MKSQIKEVSNNNEHKNNTVIYNQKKQTHNESSFNIYHWYYNYSTTGNSLHEQCFQNVIGYILQNKYN